MELLNFKGQLTALAARCENKRLSKGLGTLQTKLLQKALCIS
jgi:hypothetical protein